MSSIVAIIIAVQIHDLYLAQIMVLPGCDLVQGFFVLLQAAYYSVQTLRIVFDLFSGYKWGKMIGTLDEKNWLTRIIFLETVAGVPGVKGARK